MRSVKKFTILFISLVLLIGLAAGLTVNIVSNPSQVRVGQETNITVNATLNDTLINFSTTLGNLSANSNITNSSGIATIRINSTVAGIATVNASAGSDYNFTNVTFIAESPLYIDMNISQNPLVAGNTTNVTFTSYDQYGNENSTAAMDINITITDISGNFINSMNFTRFPTNITELQVNRTDVVLKNKTGYSGVVLQINSTLAGYINITATSNNKTNYTNITFIPAALSYISLGYINEQTVNLTSTIKVNAWDMYENPINNTIVIFNATPPLATKYNSPIEYNSQNLSPEITYTDLSGLASTDYRNDKRAGENTINISVGGSINTSITIKGLADEASDIHLSHTPDTVYANNKDTYKVMAQVVDKFLNPVYPKQVPIKEKVLFSTPLGSTLIPLNDSGVAVTLLGPTPYIQTVNITSEYITETYSGIKNYTILNFISGDFNRFAIYTNPSTVLSQNIKGNHNTTITLYALDEWGHPIPGINVTLNNTNVSLGDLIYGNDKNILNATTDNEGRIMSEFTSKIPAGNATIIVSNGSKNSSIIVYIKDEPFLSATINFEPNSTIDSGTIVNITTIITAEGEVPISRPAASAMLVLDRSGSMDPAGASLDIMLVDDVSGSMDPDSYDDIYDMSRSAFYDYSKNDNASNQTWWNDTFEINKTPVNDFNIQLKWSIGNKTDLRLQLISPSGKVYGYNGNQTNYEYDYNIDKKAAIWINKSSSKPDTDTLENGIWKIRVYGNFPSGIKNFDIKTYIEKLSAVKIASKDFNNNMISNDRLGLISFSGDYYENNPLTFNISFINDKINILKAGGDTPTAQAIRDAKNNLVGDIRPSARPYIILLSDGQPTAKLVSGSSGNEVTDAINEATNAKNTVLNGYGIKIYAIGFGTDADNATMQAIASPDSYYYAASTSQLQEIYDDIARQISDFGLNKRQYGFDGFTIYNSIENLTVNNNVWEGIITLNDNVTDFKVYIDNSNLTFNITSPNCPNCTTYPNTNEYGYVSRSSLYNPINGKYIWISPTSGKYNPVQGNNTIIQQGNWTINVSGSGAFNITTYIDKKSAVKAASRTFISCFDSSNGDRAGLALFSFSDINDTPVQSQTSYLLNGSQWVGYFTGDTEVSISSLPWDLTSPNYPGNYPNDYDNTWTNTPVPGATQIRIHFTKIDVERNNDYVYVIRWGVQ